MALSLPRRRGGGTDLAAAPAERSAPPARALRKAEAKADAAFLAHERERREEEVDAAVAWQLDRMASDAAFDQVAPKPKDPYAVHVGFRLDEGTDGRRFLVLHASKATPARDELHFEFQKRLD